MQFTRLPRTFASTRLMPRKQQTQLFGVGDELGTGDSYLIADLLPAELATVAFDKLKEEVDWKTMYHRGGEVPRLVAVEGEVGDDGSYPVYRHPADESPPLSPFSPTVSLIREYVQKTINHPVNHVLIQFYRTGADYISDHSDKTIDVVRGSNIVNVSLGAQRTMTLRLKRDKKPKVSTDTTNESSSASSSSSSSSDPPAASADTLNTGATTPPPMAGGGGGTPREVQRIPLPHNSMFVMGPQTNMKWLHGINHDNRPMQTKSPAEQFNEGQRISLTFRHIGTFMSKDGTRIWGQGAKGKTKDVAGLVVRDQEEAEALIRAFGDENQQSEFDWEAGYGNGFDVLHFCDERVG